MTTKRKKISFDGIAPLMSSEDVDKKDDENAKVGEPHIDTNRKASVATRASRGETIEGAWDKLKAQLKEEKAAREKAEAEREKAESGRGVVTIKMPVTGQLVEFKQIEVDVDLIDIPDANGRRQSLLDELSLSDILPSIRKEGQQRPGYLTVKEDGRFDSLDGSRRLASCKIAGITKYKALVGDVPVADRAKFSENENKNTALSHWEQAQIYGSMVERGDYTTWYQLGAALNINENDVKRYKALYELPELFASLFTTPTNMQKTFGQVIAQLMKKNSEKLIPAAKQLKEERAKVIKNSGSWKDAADIVSVLKSSVRARSNDTIAVKVRENKLYTVGKSKVQVKHSISTTSGSVKFEIVRKGMSEADVAAVEQLILKALNQI
ncbi:ParB/RepB/Spo0J family partition protein [Zhongshania borealis]|uniref:ParB-like N-terminal domain-containing protein n=1 Tax=Zhongshania borealis TaxID=889488 RepID=A0ABP7WLN0_9GAMM